jgi:hypothetical protein
MSTARAEACLLRVDSLGEGSGESTRPETIRNARIQINTRVSLRRSFWRVVIDRSPHKFRADELPGRTVLNEDLWAPFG